MRYLTKKELNVLKKICSLTQPGLKVFMSQFLRKKYALDTVIETDDFICAKGDIPIALVAHMDTVFKKTPENIYYDADQNVMWSSQGLGADDRAGVFAIVSIINKGYRPHIILTTDEEIGGIGACALTEFEKPFEESVSEKPFDEVEEGDIGKDYSGNEVIILAKGPASKFSNADGFEEFVDLSDYDPEDTDFNTQIDTEWPECVLVEFVEDGSKVVYSYGSDGVVVPQKRVRQISFDFIDTEKEADSDLLLMVQDAMTRLGIEIVGGPAFGDTSWSKEEYGLK